VCPVPRAVHPEDGGAEHQAHGVVVTGRVEGLGLAEHPRHVLVEEDRPLLLRQELLGHVRLVDDGPPDHRLMLPVVGEGRVGIPGIARQSVEIRKRIEVLVLCLGHVTDFTKIVILYQTAVWRAGRGRSR